LLKDNIPQTTGQKTSRKDSVEEDIEIMDVKIIGEIGKIGTNGGQ